jgi:LAS superfamily LD-carboxypeptidase LdcB
VLFSYAFFFDGYTGLAITIGAILTLFIVMQTTARVQWTEKFAVR